MKKPLIFLLLFCFLTGCAANSREADRTAPAAEPTLPPDLTVGICLPDENDPYWAQCGQLLQQELTFIGWQTVIRYGNNDVLLQQTQIRELYDQQVSCLVLACVDSVGLEDVLADYHAAGIPVIALDRMVMDTPAVSACVTYDYKAIGEAMGRYVERELVLTTAQQSGRSHTVEFFMGSPDDPNALAIHQGITAVLQPYLGSGVLTCPSGRTSFEDSWVLREDGEKAGENLKRYLEKYYEENTFPQILIAASNPLAQGCMDVLEDLNCPATQWPLITGHGWQSNSVATNRQAMTVEKDLQQLTADCVTAMRMLLTNGCLDQGFAQSEADNHARFVPVRLCGFEVLVHSQEQTGEEEPQLPTE